MRVAVALAVLVGCGGPASSPSRPEPLVFERYSPPQYTSSDVFVAAKGDVIALASRWSADGGATWQPSVLGPIERAAIHGSTIVTFADGKLVRFDTASKTMTAVANTPAYANARNWRTTPSGKLLVADGIANSIAIETASGWTTAALPQPSPTEFDPYITDLESNGSTVMVVSAWGVYRATGGTFERVAEQSAEQGRELVALADGRFVLLGGTATLRFDASGALVGDSEGIVVETGDAIGCDDGALVARGKVSRDAGGTWQPLLGGGDLTLTIERVGCGGGRYWVLGHNSGWGYRLLRFDDLVAAGTAVGNWELAGEPAWTSAGPPIVRTADGTLIAAGLAWRDGDPGWTLRLVPARTWAAGDALFGVADGKFYTSADAGRTWRALDATALDGEVEAFAKSPDGALHVSRFDGESTAAADTWHSTVWRSADQGATWSVAYDAIATRVDDETTGEAHRFVGITESGAWIAADAISEDMGVTWTPTEFEGDKHLAFVTPDGYLVTPRDDLWRVYEAGGTGSLVGTWELEAEGQRVPASELRSVAFDELGHAYIARGAPYVQVWRSTQPIMRAP